MLAEYISNTDLYIKEYFEVEFILFLLDMFCQQVGDTYICQLVMDPVPGAGTWHLNFQVTRKNAVQECLFQVARALQTKVIA